MQTEYTSRCQIPLDEQFKPCYASVVYLGTASLEPKIQHVEQRIWPTITAWCLQCKKPCMITRTLDSFKTISAHHVHQLKELERMQSSRLMD